MQQVAESVYRLGRKYHNFYVVVEQGRVTVVDAGASRELRLLEEGLETIGLGVGDVEAVVLTHAHSDHIGFAREIAESGVPVTVHEDEADFATDGSKGSQVQPIELPWWRPVVWAFVIEMIMSGAAQEYRLRSVESVADGDVLDVPGRLRVVATPGHTKGHASYVADEEVLFAGDAIVTHGLVAKATGPQLLNDVFHLDPEMARQSIDVLAAQGTRVLLPGHGEPWYGAIAGAVEEAKATV